MKKIEKGSYGYLKHKTLIESLKTVGMFLISALIMLFGYLQTGSLKNILTVVAMLGFLPACKLLTTLIIYLTRKKFDHVVYESLKDAAKGQDPLYEMILTGYKKNFYFNCLVVKDGMIFGYSQFHNFTEQEFREYLNPILVQNGYKEEVPIKIFDKSEQLSGRLLQLRDTTATERDHNIRHLLTCLSL